ncbi:integrase arm-type DNA-binding domain-containing protein [Acinetobacter sp. ANC 4178]|uniref:integrase arm-type DNA-binding domain-containing protein n=1 Tax=Acinetobacter sp. ANC 4178 TaxID=2529839 RepID=UPI0039B6FDA5
MPKIVKSLTDSKIKSLKADPNQHQRISDGWGLYLFIHKNGYKYWKFDYSRPYTKTRNTITLILVSTQRLALQKLTLEEMKPITVPNI